MLRLRTKILLTFVLTVSLFVFLNGKVPEVGRKFICEDKSTINGQTRSYSDLYRFCRVDNFYEEYYHAENPGMINNPDSAEIFVFGDSFFNTMMDTINVPLGIQYLTGKKVCNASEYKGLVINSPLGFMKKYNVKPGNRRIVVIGPAERYSFTSALKSYLKEKNNYEFFFYKFQLTRNLSFGDVEYWLNNSFFTAKPINYKSTFLFNSFGIISSEISYYSLSPKFLFFSEETNFNKMIKSPEQISAVSGNVNKLAEILDRDYNMSLIYLIIPNKYTVYGKYANSNYRYDNYIPDVYKGLSDKTNPVNLYEIYSKHVKNNPEDFIYFHSDTHYNLKGREIAIREIVKKINEISSK